MLTSRQKLGSYDLIEKKVVEAIDEMDIPSGDKEFEKELLKSVSTMLLMFELTQPDVGYVIGMEKYALFLRRICDEYDAYNIFFNSMFANDFLWAIFSQNHHQVTTPIL